MHFKSAAFLRRKKLRSSNNRTTSSLASLTYGMGLRSTSYNHLRFKKKKNHQTWDSIPRNSNSRSLGWALGKLFFHWPPWWFWCLVHFENHLQVAEMAFEFCLIPTKPPLQPTYELPPSMGTYHLPYLQYSISIYVSLIRTFKVGTNPFPLV